MTDSIVPVKEIEEKMETDKMWIIMGPQHPFSHGLWTLKIKVDGEIVVDADPIVGYLHRGWEKETENRTYPKIIPMADRLCYAASMTYTHLYCMTVEKALGIDIPEKAKYIRIVADEVCRINSHLMWLAAVGTDLGNLTVFLWAMREREYFLDLNVKLCGARMTTNYPRIGGVRNDLTELFERDVIRTVDRFEKALWDIIALMDDSSIIVSRMKGISYISREQCANIGMTGPAMRGCGVDFDIRRDDPYDNYDKVDFEVPVLTAGDSYARYMIRIEEMFQSCDIIRQAVQKIQALGKNAPYRIKTPTKERPLQDQDPHQGPGRNPLHEDGGPPRGVAHVPRVRRHRQALQAQGPQSDLYERIHIQGHVPGMQDRRCPGHPRPDRHVPG